VVIEVSVLSTHPGASQLRLDIDKYRIKPPGCKPEGKPSTRDLAWHTGKQEIIAQEKTRKHIAA
jgi:hypothetical protein